MIAGTAFTVAAFTVAADVEAVDAGLATDDTMPAAVTTTSAAVAIEWDFNPKLLLVGGCLDI